MYSWIRLLHICCVALSFSLFLGRGLWFFAGPNRPLWRVFRIAPHIVDTVLLGSGVTLAIYIHLYPFVNSHWLTAKVVALFLYIGLGIMSFHSAPTSLRARALWGAALLVFGYIVSVAISKSPMGYLALAGWA